MKKFSGQTGEEFPIFASLARDLGKITACLRPAQILFSGHKRGGKRRVAEEALRRSRFPWSTELAGRFRLDGEIVSSHAEFRETNPRR